MPVSVDSTMYAKDSSLRYPGTLVARAGAGLLLVLASLSVPHETVLAQSELPSKHLLPLVMSGSSSIRQGFVRIINHSDRAGTVWIHGIDDSGRRFGPVTLDLDAKVSRHFNSQDLESGNPDKGLSGPLGDGDGDWRLEVDSVLDIEPLAYIRTKDGFVTSMHDLVVEDESMRYHVPMFNPGSNRLQVSRLRLVNTSATEARVEITGLDDRGEPPESTVRFTLPAGGARTVTAQELEAGGSGLAGRFGNGTGKWRLFVTADRPIQLMNLLRSPTGHLTNLSTSTSAHDPDSVSTIIRPGVVAVDAPARLAQLSAANALDMCPGSAPVRVPEILHDTNAPDGYGLDEDYLPIADQLRLLGAGCLAGNDVACAATQSHAMDWARNSRLGGPPVGEHDSLFWNSTLTINMWLLSPLLSSLGVAEQRSPLAPADRAVLDRWLKLKVDQYEHGMRDEGFNDEVKDGTSARHAAHNHAVQSSIVAMSWGAWDDDEKYFEVGVEQWFITLESMRSDGSLPIETRRGARALFYVGRTLSALVQLAERAAVQGIALYDLAPNPTQTFHHAVQFFIDAVEQPDLVLPYAQFNFAPGPSQDYTVQDLKGSDGSAMGWIAPYVSRFPNHPNSRRLMARRDPRHSEPVSYLTPSLDEAVRSPGFSAGWIGVDAECFYTDPELW